MVQPCLPRPPAPPAGPAGPGPGPAGTLPAALRHALSAYPDALAARSDRVVRVLLRERLEDPSGAAWGGSRLTGDGFPVEVAFSTADDRLRLTLEPGSRGFDPARRLALAVDRVEAAGGHAVAPEVLKALTSLNTKGPLRYGAWVGCRVSPDATAFKVYVEVPDPRLRWPGHPAPLLGDRDVALRMIAHTPGTGESETYFRIPSLLPEHLPAVLAPAGAEHRAGLLLAWVEALYGHRVRGRLPGPSVGVSYRCEAGVTSSTVHFYARALWGGDRRIRACFAAVATGMGWDPAAYLAVTAPLADAAGWRTRHGIAGLTLGAGSALSLSLGGRPVAP
jgi:hypothetical protein